MNMTLENPFEDVLRVEHGNVSSVMLVFKGVMFALPKTSTQIHSLCPGATCPVVAMRWPGASKGHVGRNNPWAPQVSVGTPSGTTKSKITKVLTNHLDDAEPGYIIISSLFFSRPYMNF